MNTLHTVTVDPLAISPLVEDMPAERSSAESSAVSWGAIFAGAAAASALSLILLILGTGLGMSSVSPWAQTGISAAAFGVSTILWLTLTQIAASGMGGYLAGRLRTKWLSVQTDEVYFRDTAHGFLSWAIASLATATLLASVIGSIVSGGVQAGASVAGGLASTATAAAASGVAKGGVGDSGSLSYFVDSLFRRDMSAANSAPVGQTVAPQSGAQSRSDAASTPEVVGIFVTSLRTGALTAEDLRYVSQLVADRTGLAQPEAEKRVGATFARAQATLRDAEAAAKEAADKARKLSAYTALWLFVSLLSGAFTASFAATYGGRRRDL